MSTQGPRGRGAWGPGGVWAWIAWAAWLSMAGVAAGQNPFDVARQSGAVVDAWVGPSADVPPGDDGEAATP
ncbi:MAG: hypothetical protein JNK35_09915, partial [Phycisphaerae bacterium]|nr:hypothetical protein [Phycisphaerae bacterium]